MTFSTAQRQHDQASPGSSFLPCANCGERAEDHEMTKIGIADFYFCEDGQNALAEFLDDKSIQFSELDEDEAREDAALREAGL